MSRRKIRLIVSGALLLVLAAAAVILLANTLIQRPAVRQFFLHRISSATGYQLQAGQIRFHLRDGIGLTARDVVITREEGPEISALRVRIGLATGALITGRIVPTRVSLIHPRITLAPTEERERQEAGDLSRLIDLALGQLMELGTVSLKDGQIGIKGTPFGLQDVDLDISEIDSDKRSIELSLRGAAGLPIGTVPLAVDGRISEDPAEGPSAELELQTDEFPVKWFPAPDPVSLEQGLAAVKMRIRASPDNPLRVQGSISAKDAAFSIHKGEDKKAYAFPELRLFFEAAYSDPILEFSSLKLETAEFFLNAAWRFNLAEPPTGPFMDLNIRSPELKLSTFQRIFPDPILGGWVNSHIFPLLTAGSVRVEQFALKGPLGQIRDIGDHPGVLTVQILMEDLQVLKDESPLPFEAVSGRLEIENGVLSLSEMGGSFGRCSVQDASMTLQDLFSAPKTYDFTIDGAFVLEDLLRLRELDMISSVIPGDLEGLKSASGKLRGRLSGSFRKDRLSIKSGDFEFDHVLLTHSRLLLPLALEKGRCRWESEGQAEFSAEGEWGESPFSVAGTSEKGFETLEADITAQAHPSEILSRLYPDSHALSFRFADALPCDFSLSKVKELLRVEGKMIVDGMGLEIPGGTVAPPGSGNTVTFALERRDKAFRLRRCTLTSGKSSLTLTGTYRLTGTKGLTLEIESDGFGLQDAGLNLENGKAVRGTISCHGRLETNLQNLAETGFTGEIRGEGLFLPIEAFPSPVEDGDFRLQLADRKITIYTLSLRLGKTPLRMQGVLTGWDGLSGEIRVQSPNLRWSDILTDGNGRKSKSRFLRRSNIRIELEADRGRWKRLAFSSLAGAGGFRYGSLFVEHLRCRLEHGVLRVRGRQSETGDRSIPSFSTYLKLEAQPLKELFELFGSGEKISGGLVTTEGIFNMQGKSRDALVSSLNGQANLLIEDGVIAESHILFDIMEFLKIQNIFKKRPPDIAKDGFYFETLKAYVSIEGGILHSENFVMKSPIFNAVGRGKLNLKERKINLEIGAQPLGTVDWLLSKIPIVGYILTGEKEALLVYYFKVTGPFSHPEVKHIPLKHVGGGIIGFFKRLLLTPGRLFKEIPETLSQLE